MCFFHRCEEYFLCQYLPPQGIESVGEHIELEIALYLDKIVQPEERHMKKLIFDCLLKRETCISGCDTMSDIDLLELGSYTELQGGNISLPSGFSSILEPASKDIPPDKILKRHVVKLIKWAGADWKFDDIDNASDDSEKTVVGADRSSGLGTIPENEPVLHESDANTIEVTCDNGKRFICEHVICTIPLGVLKDKADSLFSPPLPQHKQEAIEKLLFGTVNKIFLVYERPFLHPDIEKVMLLWDVDPAQKGEIR